jgi:hypothetical protein
VCVREILSLLTTEMESCGHDINPPLHHLIYTEELKKDGDQEGVVCWWCKKPIWGGSLHNSVECGNRPVHYYSSSSINHYLDFTEKLENEVVCSECHEPVLGPTYKCSVSSECNFFIHKSCANSWFTKYVLKFLKIKVHNHFLDLIYSLHEINKSDGMFCRICGNKVNKEYAAYYCQQRTYILHTPKNF